MHKTARAFGTALQYSVFLCVLDRTDRVRLAGRIEDTIDRIRDRVILIDLGLDQDSSWIPEVEVFGRQQVARTRKHVVV
jgi:CRISPR/Cas system-associated endoribonuclease Cas2